MLVMLTVDKQTLLSNPSVKLTEFRNTTTNGTKTKYLLEVDGGECSCWSLNSSNSLVRLPADDWLVSVLEKLGIVFKSFDDSVFLAA